MSVRGDITDWVAAQLKSEITYLTDVFAVGSPTEFELLSNNVPIAAVFIDRDSRAGIEQSLGDKVFTQFAVQVMFAAARFRWDLGSGVTDQRGVYEIFDAIHTALEGQVPTGCAQPLTYQEGGITGVEDGLVIAFVEYQTAQLI